MKKSRAAIFLVLAGLALAGIVFLIALQQRSEENEAPLDGVTLADLKRLKII
jgi:hypothetical protein